MLLEHKNAPSLKKGYSLKEVDEEHTYGLFI